MNADEMIKEAMGGAGKMIGGAQVFVLEGHPERNELRILTADEALKNNIAAFTYVLNTGFVFLGMFTSLEAAEESQDIIRRLFRDEEGKNLT